MRRDFRQKMAFLATGVDVLSPDDAQVSKTYPNSHP
jgi:hypothetical protein